MSILPRISIVAAISTSDRALGNKNQLLWRISDDLKRLKAITTGHPVILGRKTYESIGKPLPNRTNIVISRNPHFSAPGCRVVTSFEEALREAKRHEEKEIFILGGAELYAHALPIVDKLYLTLIDDKKEADIFFPEYENQFPRETFREKRKTSDDLVYTWVNLERQ